MLKTLDSVSGGYRLCGVHGTKRARSLNMILLTLSLMIGTAGLPHVIIRFFTVPKVKDAEVQRAGHWYLLQFYTPQHLQWVLCLSIT